MKTPWFTHPLFVFIFSLLALATSLFLYIRSYLRVNQAFENFLKNQKLDPTQFLQSETWVMIVILSVLVAIILLGLFIIFFYYSKIIQLYRQQQNFINGFTHELKTPIASLKLFIDAFSEHELPRASQLKYIDYMKRDIERLTDNVSQILKIARLEDKSYKSQFEYIQLDQFIEVLLEKTSYHYKDLNVKFTAQDSESWTLLVEKSLLEMAVMNILTNAYLYNPKEEKNVEISLVREGKFVAIKIKDDGIGLDKSELKAIFKKFYQVGRSAKGSGLGLYMVALVMKLHRGHVFAESAGAQQGTCFTLKIPLN